MRAWMLSQHAREEIVRRGIPQVLLNQVLNSPQQTTTNYPSTGLLKKSTNHSLTLVVGASFCYVPLWMIRLIRQL